MPRSRNVFTKFGVPVETGGEWLTPGPITHLALPFGENYVEYMARTDGCGTFMEWVLTRIFSDPRIANELRRLLILDPLLRAEAERCAKAVKPRRTTPRQCRCHSRNRDPLPRGPMRLLQRSFSRARGDALIVAAGPHLAARIADPKAVPVQYVTSWDDLLAATANRAALTVVFADPFLERPGSPNPQLRDFRSARPFTPVVALITTAAVQKGTGDVLDDWGVEGMLNVDDFVDEARARDAFLSAFARPFVRRMASLPIENTTVRLILAHACATAVAGEGSSGLAARLRCAAPTAQQMLRRAGLPPPRRLLAWMRVLHASLLLENRSHSFIRAATVSGYATDNALRRTLRTLAKVDPASTTREELFGTVRRAFVQELSILDRPAER